ncbi:MAG: class I SAM-dependent methyltransferase [Nanoarchaeota archaeon]
MEKQEKIEYERYVHSKIASDYENVLNFVGSGLFHKYWNESFVKFVNLFPKAKILDNGCGSGLLLRDLKDKDLELYGVDISKEMVEAARKEIINVKVADSEELPFKDGFFDIIFCRASIHHFHSYGKSLREMKRVLKKKGKLVVTEPFDNFVMWIPRKINQIMNKERFEKHEILNKKEFFILLKGLGFKVEKKEYFGYIGMPILASPEIFPIFQVIAKNKLLSKLLILIDKALVKVPLVNRSAWHINFVCSI